MPGGTHLIFLSGTSGAFAGSRVQSVIDKRVTKNASLDTERVEDMLVSRCLRLHTANQQIKLHPHFQGWSGERPPQRIGGLRGFVSGGCVGPVSPHLFDTGHCLAQILQPLRLMLAHQPDAPGERFTATPRHPGIDQGVQHLALRHA